MATQGEQPQLTLQDLEARIRAHLNEMDKESIYEFDTWLACNQALMQIYQLQLLQGVFEILSQWHTNGVPIYAMAI